ncbi:LVIVD repeat-containing protein [Maribacter sp. 2304DJ31-5]|uniref:LVIVD repeat-containing protein n=1 Tax=Maribacter sp. 2304DJ31-5 TaxID=3386273 RepID=UPI0039BD0EDA
MKKNLFLLFIITLTSFVSCDNDGPYEEYLVARPVVVDAIAFKTEAIDIVDPVPIVSSGKIYAYQDYIFVNDVDRGFHVVDNRNPASPKSIAFIKLEGNNDISIKDDKLYADSYGDLVIFDISDIDDIKLTGRVVNAIYNNGGIWIANLESPRADIYDYGDYDSQRDVIVDWEIKTERRLVSDYEKQFSCNSCEFALNNSDSGSPQPTVGQGGSLARFKIVGDYLYVVDYSNINIFDISNLEDPKVLDDVKVAWDIETIFNQGDILFIGGRQGMYIYDIKDPVKPEFISEFRHGTACDPVVVDGDYAYVTLKGGGFCGSVESGLYVVDVSDLKNPELKVIYPMDGPSGLGIKGDQLFICDGSSGLKVFDKSDAPNVTQLNHFENIVAYDVIPLANSLLMIGDQTLYQYEYLDSDIQLISTFDLK